MGADFFESKEDIERRAEEGIPPIGISGDCEIRNAIIDKNARIGRGVKLVNSGNATDLETDLYSIRDGITIIPKNAVIPDGMVI